MSAKASKQKAAKQRAGKTKAGKTKPGKALPFRPKGEGATRRSVAVAASSVVLITLLMFGLLGRVAWIQARPDEPIAKMVNGHVSGISLKARRGNLLDRNGRVMATSGISWKLFVDPALIQDPGAFAEHVGHGLGYDPALIEQKLWQAKNPRYVVIDGNMPERKLDKLREMRTDEAFAAIMRPVGAEMWLERRYPLGTLGGQVVGFVGANGKGVDGAEAAFNRTLGGESGRLRYTRDARRRPIGMDDQSYQPPRDGRPVQLSIDLKLQDIVEQELLATCQEFDAESAQAVIMDPDTGEVLAMGSYPFFDPNNARALLKQQKPIKPGEIDREPKPWHNRCVTEVFEPGSTFKPFVWAAATQAGYARPGQIMDCGPGYWRSSKGRALRDAYPVGKATWAKVLIKSSNIGMAIVGEKMGERKLYAAVRSFGFGSKTQSGLSGEERGLVVPLKRWTHYSVTSVPMGQEIGVTGMQMARAVCVIANGGLMVTPTLRKMGDGDLLSTAPVFERVLDKKTADLTLRTMRRVVTEGTGRKLKDSKYAIFGKTGTAQIPRSGDKLKELGPGYEQGAYTACFVGGAPADAPKLVIALFVRKPDPKKGYYGGVVAGPCVKRILERSLQYMGVAPMKDDDRPLATAVARAE